MTRWRNLVSGISLLCISISYAQSNAVTWQTIAKGLQYTQITLPSAAFTYGKLHAFQIDLDTYQLDLVFARDQKRGLATAEQFAQTQKAVLAINGGFFNPKGQPLGLRIQQGEQRSPMKSVSWWGVFYIKGQRPYIVSQRRFHQDKSITLALQAGPRLLSNGKVLSLKPGQAQRSVLCVTNNNKLIIAVTEHAMITTTDLAKQLRRTNRNGGLACRDALNLDGGSSSQLYATVGNFTLNITGFGPVADAIVVKDKP